MACGHWRSELRQVLRAFACSVSSTLIWSMSQSPNSIKYSRVERWRVLYRRVEMLGVSIALFVQSCDVPWRARLKLDMKLQISTIRL